MRDLSQKTVSSTTLHKGRIISLRSDQVRLQNGLTVERLVVDHPGAVAVVPVLPDGRIVLVRQWRYAVGGPLLELPAGGLEPGEDPAEAAERELQEEIGYKPGRLEKLATFYTAPGFTNELMHLYLADGLTPSRLPGDEDEDIEVVTLTLAEALADPEAQRDAKTLVALGVLAQRGAGR